MSYLLAVYLFDRRVGDLALVEGRLQFSYDADWLQHADAALLSCSLPLQVEPFNDLQARPFFAGLLPEGKLRQLVARQFQVSKQSTAGTAARSENYFCLMRSEDRIFQQKF